MSPNDWLRRLFHGRCDDLVNEMHAGRTHARARVQDLEAALDESAAAHHDAEVALAQAREENDRLAGEAARARAETDQMHATWRDTLLALAALLSGDPDAEARTRALRETGDVQALLAQFFEIGAMRSCLEHTVDCPDADLGEHLEAAARRLIGRTDDRGRELREATKEAVT